MKAAASRREWGQLVRMAGLRIAIIDEDPAATGVA